MRSAKVKETKSGTCVENSYVSECALTSSEKEIWELKDIVLKAIGGLPDNINEINIAEVVRFDDDWFVEGQCKYLDHEIVISRASLYRKESFLSVLLHELAHARSGAGDNTKEFEDELSNMLGVIAASLCEAVGYNRKNVIPAKTLDNSAFENATCVCVKCGSISFDCNEDKTFVKCKACGKEYSGGYLELVDSNRKLIEKNGFEFYIKPKI